MISAETSRSAGALAFGVLRTWCIALALLWACVAVQAEEAAVGDAATATRTQGPPPPQVDASYMLYPGDRIQISVFDHADLTVTIHVPSNGVISFPLIGDVTDLVGRTVEDLRRELKGRLEDGYITEAIITVSFEEFAPRNAYVMGHVKNPSSVALSPFAPLTAMQAISKSGGFAEGANRAGAHVLRDDLGTGKKLSLPLPAADRADDMSGDVVLRAGDIVIIPRQDRIFILGQVKKPGAVDLPGQESLTVSKAISLAGGFERFGRQDEVQIIRAGDAIRLVNVKRILSGDRKAEDPVLRPGDTVFVPETRF